MNGWRGQGKHRLDGFDDWAFEGLCLLARDQIMSDTHEN
jgi:hypothetical protein